MTEDMRRGEDASKNSQEEVSRKYGLRWSVLAAWQNDLSKRASGLPREVLSKLEVARVKISSGCFSVCEVGCDLRQIEAMLTSADSSVSNSKIDEWLEVLGRAMGEACDVEELLKIPAIKIHFKDCQSRGCSCAA